ncbi:MAG: PhnD/SsuA/transferrin family substrate-binding protein [Deltaproteobacteria bacterium]|nr:PhnD/SsuA/transferrin family substrate-binding protein [Deltaproteobacteria bacterium]
MRRGTATRAWLLAGCTLSAACTTTEHRESTAPETVPSGLLPAPAPEQVAGRPLRLLFIPFASTREQEHEAAARITTYLETRTGLAVQPILTSNYEEAARAFLEDEADAAFLAPLLYVQVAERFARDPALRGVRLRLLLAAVAGGSPSYVGYVVAPTDTTLRELRDAAGLPFGLIEDSTSGYLYPLDLLESRGLDPAEFLRDARLYRRHGDVLADLLRPPGERRLAAGALYHNIVDTLPDDQRARLRLLAKTARIPRDAVAVRIPLVGGREDPERLRVAAALQHALLVLDDDPAMAASLREGIGYDGWIVGDDRRYDAIRKVHQRFGHYRFGARPATDEGAGATEPAGAATEARKER